MVKRAFDVTVSLAALVLLSPLFLVVGLIIALDSRGGIFFLHERVGYRGKTFRMFKFRSMVADADVKGPYYTDKGDPRITRIGRFIRKTSIDELPQLINVIRGELSLVGPRPDVPAQRPLYTEEEWNERHSVLPGITGMAQATRRSTAGMEERKQLDLAYVRSHSFGQDLRIILLTIRQVLFVGSY